MREIDWRRVGELERIERQLENLKTMIEFRTWRGDNSNTSTEGYKETIVAGVWPLIPKVISRIDLLDSKFSRPGTETVEPEAKEWSILDLRAYITKKNKV